MVREDHFDCDRSARIVPCGRARLRLFVGRMMLCIPVVICVTGCASKGYRYGRFHPQEPDGAALQPVVVERGRPHKTLDRLAWVAGLPSRVFTLHEKTNNHDVSAETVDQLTTYLERNDITNVYVSINDYDPKGQWRRLKENDRISPFWRYTVGTGSWLGYTLFPNRVFGGDEYNPFTNTLIVSSDVPALVLAEAAYAKDIRSQRHPGLYATVNDLPVVSLWRHSRATSDVLAYARVHGDWNTEREAYHVLYPQVGSTTFGPASHFVPVAGPFLSAGGALVGHATGRTASKLQEPKTLVAEPSGSRSDSSLGPVGTTAEFAETRRPGIAESPSRRKDSGVVQAGYEEPANPE